MADPSIGSARIELRVDTSKFNAELDTSRKQVEGFAKTTGAGANRALNTMGRGVEVATEGIRKFTGSITAVAGVITGWISVIALATTALAALAKGISQAKSRAEEYAAELEVVGDTLNRVFRRDAAAIAEAGLNEEILRRNADRAAELRKEYKELEDQVNSFFAITSAGFGEENKARLGVLKEELETLDLIIARDQKRVREGARRLAQEKEIAEQQERAAEAKEKELKAEQDLLRLRQRQRFGTSNQALFNQSRGSVTGRSSTTPPVGGQHSRVGSG